MKNSNDIIGNRSRDLPVCSAVPQPLRHRVHLADCHCVNIFRALRVRACDGLYEHVNESYSFIKDLGCHDLLVVLPKDFAPWGRLDNW
jgi:hypothetical protein